MPSISLGAKQGDRTLGLLWRGHHKTMHNSALCQKFSLVLFPQRGALFTSTCINLKESSDFMHKDGKLVTKFWDEANAAQCPGQMYCTNPEVFCTFKPCRDQYKMFEI